MFSIFLTLLMLPGMGISYKLHIEVNHDYHTSSTLERLVEFRQAGESNAWSKGIFRLFENCNVRRIPIMIQYFVNFLKELCMV